MSSAAEARLWSCLNKGDGLSSGFTLVEMALTLAVLSILISAGMMGLGTYQEIKEREEAKKQLELVCEALYGYAMAYKRFPCPADPTLGTGAEDRAGSACTGNREVGVLPWGTLGVGAQDSWNHRISYHVDPAFVGSLPAQAGALSITDDGVAYNVVTVFFSHGRNPGGAYELDPTMPRQALPTETDELENADDDRNYVKRVLRDDPTAPTTNFDDAVKYIKVATIDYTAWGGGVQTGGIGSSKQCAD